MLLLSQAWVGFPSLGLPPLQLLSGCPNNSPAAVFDSWLERGAQRIFVSLPSPTPHNPITFPSPNVMQKVVSAAKKANNFEVGFFIPFFFFCLYL